MENLRAHGWKRRIRKLSAAALLCLALAAALVMSGSARRRAIRAPVRPASETQDGDNAHLYPMKAGNRWGYIDAQGRWAIPARYAYARPFADGVALVEYPGMCLISYSHRLPCELGHVMEWRGIIDATGKALTNIHTAVVGEPSEGLVAAVRARDCLIAGVSDGLVGYVDTAGVWQIEPAFKYAGNFSEGLAWATKSGKVYGYIDRAGNWAIAPQFHSVGDFHDGLARVRVSTVEAFADRDGNLMVVPRDAHTICDFSEGLASARYRDESGEGAGFITKSGKWAFKIPDAGGCWHEHGFREGLAILGKDGLYGYVDKLGEWQIPPRFRYADVFSEGLAEVTDERGKSGYIDSTGEYVFELNPRRGGLYPFRNGLAPVGIELDATGSYIVCIEGYVRKDGTLVGIE